jgi:hypothetical protein
MHRSFVVTRAVLALVGLLLVGPQKASADVVFACVNSTTGLLYVVSATTNCPPPSSGATWNKISWNASAAQPAGTTNLLFPWVQSGPGLDTLIIISNTSADPFNTATQMGTCTISVFGGSTTPTTFTTPAIPPGSTTGFFVSSIVAPRPEVMGYAFVSCNFSYAHGAAQQSSLPPAPPTAFAFYLAVVVQTPRPNGENLNN